MVADIMHNQRNTEYLFNISSDIIQMLSQAGETVGAAESVTGGGIMAALTSVPLANSIFRGGVVPYSTPLKHKLLNVDADLIAREGVIHANVASQMAEGARKITTFDNSPTTWGIATTGVAGPERQDGKPVGMVFIALASPDGSRVWGPYCFSGTREWIREATVMAALSRLREVLADRRDSKVKENQGMA